MTHSVTHASRASPQWKGRFDERLGRCRWFIGVPAGLLVMSTVSAGAVAPEPEPPEALVSYVAEMDFSSRYVWRGLTFSPGAVLQPSAAVAYRDFKFTAWGNCNVTGPFQGPRWTETDLTLAWEHTWGAWSMETSFQGFLYPPAVDVPNTAEGVVKVGYTLGDFEVFLRQSVDVAAYAGAYFGELGVAWEQKLGAGFSLAVVPTLAVASDKFTLAYANVDAGGLYSCGLEMALTWRLGKHLALRPHLGASHLLSEAMRQSVSDPNLIWGGLAATLEF